jgi:L-ascorbate metabolism protein UlaG (beta-lactamase superfamily)
VLRITHIRNSTLLLDFGGFRVLTDPWFIRNLAGWPVWKGPGLTVEQLPPVHLVAVSHFHPDHWAAVCARHVAKLNPTAWFVGPGGAERRFDRAGVNGEGMAAGAVRRFGDVEVTSVACAHAQRGPEQVNFVFRWRGSGVYFGGDSKLGPEFDACGHDHDVDVALLPVGDARICGCRQVMAPKDAVEAGRRLGARYAVPIHQGGLWPTLPPLYTSRGRARHFADLCAADVDAPVPVQLRRGGRATFTLDGALYLYGTEVVPGSRGDRWRMLRGRGLTAGRSSNC